MKKVALLNELPHDLTCVLPHELLHDLSCVLLHDLPLDLPHDTATLTPTYLFFIIH